MEKKSEPIILKLESGQPKAEYARINYGNSFINFINDRPYRDKGITKISNWDKKWYVVVDPKNLNIASLYSYTLSFHMPVSSQGVQGAKIYVLYLFFDSKILEVKGNGIRVISKQDKQELVEWAVQERQKKKNEINIGYA